MRFLTPHKTTYKAQWALSLKGEAVSDFAIGLMLSECRNIARAHFAITNGQWRKQFSNSSWVPQLKDKNVGIVGFGYIGRLVAQKLSGFGVKCLVFDPFVNADEVRRTGCTPVDKDTLFDGTSSLKAMLYDSVGNMLNRASQEYHSEFFRDNHVEQDPFTWKSALLSTLKKSGEFSLLDVLITDKEFDERETGYLATNNIQLLQVLSAHSV